MQELGRNNIVTFAHDEGEGFHVLHKLYLEFKRHKSNRKYARNMADFVPLDDKLHTSIQAADVAASVVYRYAEEWAIDPNPNNLKRLRGNMYKIVFWNETAAKLAVTI